MVLRVQRKRGATTHAKKRNNAAQKAADDAKFVDDVFAKYDTSHDGKLGQAEMCELLTKLNGGEAPSEAEVQLIVDSVDRRGGTSDGAINKDELKEAMLEWRNYKEHEQFITEKFVQYDTDKKGTLDREELRGLLKDLNEGIDVTEAELDMVIGFSDKGQVKDGLIDKTELVQAIAVWFSNCTMDGDDKDQPATFNDGKAADQPGTEPAPNSACCVLL